MTIPDTLREGIDLRMGDIVEATLVGDAILLEPKEVVDRNVIADRIAAMFAAARASSDDLGRSEDEIMRDTIAEIARSRRERRGRTASVPNPTPPSGQSRNDKDRSD